MNSNTNIKKLLIKYGVIVAVLVGVFLLGFFAVYLVIGGGTDASAATDEPLPNVTAGPRDLEDRETPGNQPSQNQTGQNTIDNMFSAPRKTNFLILGLDQSKLLSDVNIVGSFDSFTGKIELISIPRDTQINVTQADVDAITALGRYIPSHGTVKLTELHSYAGSEHGHAYSQKYIEKLLDIKIDYYFEVDISAFRYIVDTLGGIEVTIPKGGLKYSAPDQNLYINLPEGRRKLTGQEAEHYVRFRDGYANADIGRIAAQQNFMNEMFMQVLNMDEVMSNPQLYLKTFVNYVKTDFPIADITKYLNSIAKLDTNKISFYTAPGEATSYFYPDEKELAKLIDETIKNYEIGLTDTQKALRIEILNGGNSDSLCQTIVTRLRSGGYENVSFGGAYDGSQINETRIMLRRAGNAELLELYFVKPKIEIDSSLKSGFDIIIIVGKSEK